MTAETENTNHQHNPWSGILDILLQSPPVPGMADIFCVGSFDVERTALAAAALAMVGSDEGPYADVVTVVLPPADATSPSRADFLARVAASAASLIGHDAAPETPSWVTDRVTVRRSADFEASSLMAAFPATGERQVILVADAARYQPTDWGSDPSGGLRPSEDLWCGRLSATAAALVVAAKLNGHYVLLDAGEDAPRSAANLARLESIDDCGVTLATQAGPPPLDLAPYLRAWDELIAQGRAGAVLQAIDELPDANVAKRPLRIQMMSRAGLRGPAMSELQAELKETPRPDPDVAVAFAKVAIDANEHELAERLLVEAAPNLVEQGTLSAALELADGLGAEGLAQGVAARLERLYPQSEILVELRIRNAVRDRKFTLASELLLAAERDELGRFYGWLATALPTFQPSFEGFPDALTEMWPDQIGHGLLAAALQADDDGQLARAVRLLMSRPAPQLATANEVLQLLRLMRKRLLHGAKDETLEADFVEVLTTAFAYLGENPADATVRQRAARLMSPDLSGARGLVCGVLALRGLANLPLEVRPHIAPDEDPTTDIDGLFDAAVDHFMREPFNGIGLTRLPESVLPEDFDPNIDRSLLRLVERLPVETEEEDELEAALGTLGIVTALAPYLADQDTDLAAIRTTAAKLVVAGRAQRARDLVEVVLQIAGERRERRRLAWVSYGDTYLRTGDRTEAVVALGAGLTCLGPISVNQAWTESLALARLFRDVGVPRPALRILDRAEAFMRASDLLEANADVLETQRLLIEMVEATSTGSIDPDALGPLLERISTATESVLNRPVELPTLATLLGQTLRLARQIGLALDARHEEVLARALQGVSPEFARQLRAFHADVPTAESLADLASRMEPARFASDVGFDIGNLALLARRYLSGAATAGDPKLAAYAIELLADQSITRAPGDEAVTRAPIGPDAPFETALAISKTGLGVTLLGLDEASRLVRMEVVDGAASPPVTEARATFDADAFRRWRQQYPYGYGFIDERPRREDGTLDPTPDLGAFLGTLKNIGVSHLPPQRVVLILDTDLQSLPPNVLKVGDEFAARSSAMATAPSLTWLHRAEQRRARPAGAACAWISTAESTGRLLPALPIMADRLRPSLADHGIPLLTDSSVPNGLQGLELAIIGAHGGLQAAEGRFFQSVSDEDQLRLEGRALAAALANTKVVVLFVCSGGRLDANPAGRGVAGLARRLLDEGCSAVIGSPWPMSANVPPYWLPTFLEAWRLGLPVIDANHYANDAVRNKLSETPETCLAMSVYGDPLVCKVGS